MKEQIEIILSGVGGQGLLVCGSLIGEAAIVYDDLNATMASEYGIETRGTFTKSDVIVSSSEIFYPEATNPQFILALAQVAYDRYAKPEYNDNFLVYDTEMVTKVNPDRKNQVGYPITAMARELGNIAMANILSVGIIVKKTGIVSKEAVHNCIDAFFSAKGQKMIDMNIKAFEDGFNLD